MGVLVPAGLWGTWDSLSESQTGEGGHSGPE